VQYNNIIVTLKSVREMTDYTVRIFTLEKVNILFSTPFPVRKITVQTKKTV